MQIIINVSLIFVTMLLNLTNQSDRASKLQTMSMEKSKQLEVELQLPTEIQEGKSCEVLVEIKNVSSSGTIVNKRLAVGYQNSLSRELYVTICSEGSVENVGLQKVLYERLFSTPEDYVWLPSGEKINTKFSLFDWYEFPKAGKYTIQICYQADENLAYIPEGLCAGVFCSAKKTVIFESH